jgi:hypothetical protein
MQASPLCLYVVAEPEHGAGSRDIDCFLPRTSREAGNINAVPPGKWGQFVSPANDLSTLSASSTPGAVAGGIGLQIGLWLLKSRQNRALLTDPWVFGSARQAGAVAAEGEHG